MPQGWEIIDFVLVYLVHSAPEADFPLDPWDGGSHAGWQLGAAYSTSFNTWSAEQYVLRETLERSQAEEWDYDRDEKDEKDE